VVEAIVQGLGSETTATIDLTLPRQGGQAVSTSRDDLAIIGTPVYAGRIPPVAVKRLKKIKGNGAACVLVVMYGNREYEDALLELKNCSARADFRPVAGGAFVGEHSYHTDEMPVAPGRPDSDDLEKATAFGRAIRQKIGAAGVLDDIQPLSVPGRFPYKKEIHK
jgi:hypothetical protein